MVRRTILGDDSFAVRRAALPHEKHAMRVRNINEDSFAVRRAVSGERLAVSCNEVAFRAAPLPFVYALRIFRSSSAAYSYTFRVLFLKKTCVFLNMVVTLYALKGVCT
jgi:hypothetical protein